MNASLETFEFGARKVSKTSEFDNNGAIFFEDAIGVFDPVVFAGSPPIAVVARIGTNLDNPREFTVVDPDQDPEILNKPLKE